MMNQVEKRYKDILLVPSAILVPNELRLDIGSIPTGMIPLEGRPALEHIAEAYDDYELERVIAVEQSVDTIRQYATRSEYEWKLVEVTESENLAETIQKVLQTYDHDELISRNLYLNFADTIVSPIQPIEEKNYISYRYTDRVYRWTTFSFNDGNIEEITPKYSQTDIDEKPTFVGQFAFTDINSFQNALTATKADSTKGIAHFYRALMYYLSDSEYELFQPKRWLDLGHLDTYYESRKQSVNTREFNDIKINKKNVMVKRSDDTDTLINEISWYTELPASLKPYLPQVYDWSTDHAEPWIKLEYIGYPSLSDLQLYSGHSEYIWNSIFYHLLDMLSEFDDFKVEADQHRVKTALETMYIEKTNRRLERLRQDARFTPFFESDTVKINGEEHPSVETILENLREIVVEFGLLEKEDLSVIHGDLCLPNILYDPRNSIIKLIDPRGDFDGFTTHGDYRYDLAKLRHSFVGNYEHLIYNQFQAQAEPEAPSLSYEVFTTDAQDKRGRQFDTILENQTTESLDSVMLIEALLFLSMVPLHNDDFERQACMLAKGLEKVTPFIEQV